MVIWFADLRLTISIKKQLKIPYGKDGTYLVDGYDFTVFTIVSQEKLLKSGVFHLIYCRIIW